VTEHRELGVTHPAPPGERVPQAPRLAHRNYRVVAIVQQHDERRVQVRQVMQRRQCGKALLERDGQAAQRGCRFIGG